MADFRTRKIRNKEGQKVSVLQEDITIINMYAPNNRALKYTKQELI